MSGRHMEESSETTIEEHVTPTDSYPKGNGTTHYRQCALLPLEELAFVQKSQPENWEYLPGMQTGEAEATFMDDLCPVVNPGHERSLAALRRGSKCFGKLCPMAHSRPTSSKSNNSRPASMMGSNPSPSDGTVGSRYS